ncbi:unnamed protein product [Owenia fusiformis]|nr:unnamed protein product [Owenia fusiformis]
MQSGPVSAHVLARQDAISHWRKIMGPTKVFRTIFKEPNSIRGQYGLTDTRNCAHGSDSPISAAKEIQIFFPDFSIDEWYRSKGHLFTRDNVVFDEQSQAHVLLKDINSSRVQYITNPITNIGNVKGFSFNKEDS